MKCDGLLPEKMTSEGQVDVTPDDVREIKAYVDANRTLDTPYDIVMSGKITGLDPSQRQEQLDQWMEAGATWWIEVFWGEPEQIVPERIRRGPPRTN